MLENTGVMRLEAIEALNILTETANNRRAIRRFADIINNPFGAKLPKEPTHLICQHTYSIPPVPTSAFAVYASALTRSRFIRCSARVWKEPLAETQ